MLRARISGAGFAVRLSETTGPRQSIGVSYWF
jgi:hypothetical protein